MSREPAQRRTRTGGVTTRDRPIMTSDPERFARKVEKARALVSAAFSGLEIPRADSLVLDEEDPRARKEAERTRRTLAGKNWQAFSHSLTIPREVSPSLYCLSAEAFRYYLRGLLDRCLRDFRSRPLLIDSALNTLTPSCWYLYWEGADVEFTERVSLFTASQYEAVCTFLQLVLEELPGHEFFSAKAIRWGWDKYENAALRSARSFYTRMHQFQYPQASDPEVPSVSKCLRHPVARKLL